MLTCRIPVNISRFRFLRSLRLRFTVDRSRELFRDGKRTFRTTRTSRRALVDHPIATAALRCRCRFCVAGARQKERVGESYAGERDRDRLTRGKKESEKEVLSRRTTSPLFREPPYDPTLFRDPCVYTTVSATRTRVRQIRNGEVKSTFFESAHLKQDNLEITEHRFVYTLRYSRLGISYLKLSRQSPSRMLLIPGG